jgi:pentatricopeptide repeat protein
VDAILRGGLRRYTDQVGHLWNSLADYYIRSGLFERARDIYEESIQGRDSPIFLSFFYLFSKLLLNCF